MRWSNVTHAQPELTSSLTAPLPLTRPEDKAPTADEQRLAKQVKTELMGSFKELRDQLKKDFVVIIRRECHQIKKDLEKLIKDNEADLRRLTGSFTGNVSTDRAEVIRTEGGRHFHKKATHLRRGRHSEVRDNAGPMLPANEVQREGMFTARKSRHETRRRVSLKNNPDSAESQERTRLLEDSEDPKPTSSEKENRPAQDCDEESNTDSIDQERNLGRGETTETLMTFVDSDPEIDTHADGRWGPHAIAPHRPVSIEDMERIEMDTRSFLGRPDEQYRCNIKENLRTIVRSSLFENTMGTIIVMNTIFLGVQASVDASSTEDQGKAVWHVLSIIDVAFCSVFVIELLLKIGAYQSEFFAYNHLRWNLFDTIVVTLQVADEIIKFIEVREAGSRSTHGIASAVRILRLARIVRIVRILRFFESLDAIMNAAASLIHSSMWAVAVILVTMYAFSVILMSILPDHALYEHQELLGYFGSVSRTMLTLFECMCGGLDWNSLVQSLATQMSPTMATVFVFCVACSFLITMNILLSVVLDQIVRLLREDKDEQLAHRVNDVFFSATSEVELTAEKFVEKINHETMQEYFKVIDVVPSPEIARSIFELIDVDRGGTVDSEEIVAGCLRLRGPAKSLDVQLLLQQTDKIRESVIQQRHSMEKLRETVKVISEQLEELQMLDVDDSTGTMSMRLRGSIISNLSPEAMQMSS